MARTHSLETRRKMSLSHKGKQFSAETRRRISEAKRGVPMPEHQKELLRTINTGRVLSEEHRQKVSMALKGHKHSVAHNAAVSKARLGFKMSEEQKKKLSKIHKGKHCGEKNGNWRGGITPKNTAIRNSIEYKQWRTAVFERDGYTCVLCTASNCELNADHIKPFALFPELRLDISNGRTLCIPCHKDTPTFKGRTQTPRVMEVA